ncbi:MAG: CYTH domain-containing protein [Paucibacter sp.]|nr:CYTH domain-containing protein [Roseateles sp.]
MGIEIERKFLVDGEDWKRGVTPQLLSQGYLNRDKQRTVRVRVAGDAAWLTIKGESSGATRAEFEYAIPLADAMQLLSICDGPRIEKYRWRVPHGGLVWEVDEFLGENAGLVVAEVELVSEDQAFDKPSWAGAEVTDDPRYFNSSLASRPYLSW